MFGLLLGAALGQRALGVFILFYALIAIALHGMPRPIIGKESCPIAAVTAAGFCARLSHHDRRVDLGGARSVQSDPRAVRVAHFRYPIKALLSGETYLMADVPRWYAPAYLAIKLPLVLLLGAILGLLAIARSAAERSRETAFIALFPVLCEVTSHGPAFSGMRHFMFVVPPLAALAGIGFDTALRWIESRHRALARAAAASLGVWFLFTASVLVRLHPYEYLFFNPIVGGLSGAAQRYDTDYWVNGMHEMVSELESFLDREQPRSPRTYFVAVCGERLPFEKEAAAGARLKWATDSDPADFFIAPTHQSCDTAIDGKVILKIERLGVPIGVVKDRRLIVQQELARSRAMTSQK